MNGTMNGTGIQGGAIHTGVLLRRWVAAVACIALLIPVVAAAAPTESAISAVASDVADAIAGKRGDFRAVAIFPFANDRNEVLAVAVTGALLTRGISVVDRNDANIQTLLGELRRSGSDLYATENAPQFGDLRVADAVLIAEVMEYDPGNHSASMKLKARLIKTQTGDVLWSGIVSAWRPSATAVLVPGSIIGVIALVILLAMMAKHRRRKTSQVMIGRDMDSRRGQALGKGTSDEDLRNGISRSINNSKTQLSSARASIEKLGDMEVIKATRDVERSIDMVRKHVETSATGRPDTMSVGQAKDTFKFDESMLKAARMIEQICNSAAEAALMEDLEGLKARVMELKVEVHRFSTAFSKRDDRLGGV